jgi:hypothetical protein
MSNTTDQEIDRMNADPETSPGGIDSIPSPADECLCLRCGYAWVPRVAIPRECPHCKSQYWNIPRRVKVVENGR